jgi:putative ABC transport system substrate-binding protein
MRWKALLPVLLFAFIFGCGKKAEKMYTIGIFQITDSPTLIETRKGFIKALTDSGLRDGVNVRLEIRNAMGDMKEAQRIAQEFVKERTDAIVALSTPCLQAALMATQKIPIIFSSVANPLLLGVGRSVDQHLRNVTGVASAGPVKQMLALIREVLPGARRVGTLWTPAELNSDYYLRLAREAAAELGFEIIAVPVANANEVLFAAQRLLNERIDVLYPISDNTINSSFESVGRVAEENGIPLFGGILVGARLGACAAMGWDFSEMGYRTGQIAIRVKNGEDPGQIPLQSMSRNHLILNLAAAKRQGVKFPAAVIQRADEVVGQETTGGQSSGNL